MHADITRVNNMTLSRIDQLERGAGANAQRFDVSGGFSAGGVRGYQIWIPDPKAWNLTVLKNGESGFLPWRK